MEAASAKGCGVISSNSVVLVVFFAISAILVAQLFFSRFGRFGVSFFCREFALLVALSTMIGGGRRGKGK